MTAAVGQAALLAIIDYKGVAEDEFNDWYNNEHTPEREVLDGFNDLKRFVSADGGTLSVALYELRDMDVLASPEYLATTGENYSPWSKRIFARTRRFDRYALDLVAAEGPAGLQAGAVLTIACNAIDGRDAELGKWLGSSELARAAAVPGVVAARYYTRNSNRGPCGHVLVYLLENAGVANGGAWGDNLGFLPSGEARALIRDAEWTLTSER
ncbi:MAG: hypothetical protein ACT4QF_06890 [Sporichthyaceae bacterium]